MLKPIALKWLFCYLGVPSKETCDSVWPPNASLRSSGMLQLLMTACESLWPHELTNVSHLLLHHVKSLRKYERSLVVKNLLWRPNTSQSQTVKNHQQLFLSRYQLACTKTRNTETPGHRNTPEHPRTPEQSKKLGTPNLTLLFCFPLHTI